MVALEAAQQAALKGAVQELPDSGMEHGQLELEICQYVSERFGISLSRSMPQLSAPAGILLQTPQETAAQG